jgi:probable O-glycosylation ligase (exosortase A-associated)
MRDMVMLAAMLAMVPMAFMNGFVAFLFWGYTTVLTPAHYLFGFMQGVRFNFIFAALALAILFLRKTPNENKPILGVTYWLLFAFLIHAGLSTLFAFSPNPLIAEKFEKIIKGFAFVLALPFFVKDRNGIHAVLLMVALGLGLHGVIEGLKFIASGGGHRMNGIPDSSLTDNNLFAVGMVMVLPIIFYFNQVLKNKYAKWVTLFAALLTILTIIATNSRGGFLALAVLGAWYFIASRKKGYAVVVVIVAAVLVLAVAPDTWFERISSIKEANEDSSFMTRVAAWKVSMSIGLANPIFGGGFSGIQNYWIWDMYKDMPSIIPVDVNLYTPKAAHSIYFQVLGDLGVYGLILFLSILATAFVARKSIAAKIKKSKRTDLVWAIDISNAIFLSLLGFMVGGAGVSLPYYEIVYILVSLMAILNGIVTAKIKEKPVLLT